MIRGDVIQFAGGSSGNPIAWNGQHDAESTDVVLFVNTDLNNTWYLGFKPTIAVAGLNTIPLPPNATVNLSAKRTVYAVSPSGTASLLVIPGGAAYFQGLTQGNGQLVLPAMQSPNFIPGVSGWAIRKDGTAEFHAVILATNGPLAFPDNAQIFFTNEIGPSAQPFLTVLGPEGFGGLNQALLSLFAESSDATKPAQALVQTIVVGGNPGFPSTADLLEVDGVIGSKGFDTSLSAPSPAQALAINVVGQLTDLTRDYMLYLTFSGAGNLTINIGNANPPTRTVIPATAVVAGALYPVRIPAGWFIKLTGTGTVAIASQNVVGC